MEKYTVKIVNTATGAKSVVKADLTKAVAKQMIEMMNTGAVPGIEFVMVKQLNAHEQATKKLIRRAASEWIGGYENTLEDYPEDSEEYQEAKEILTHDRLFEAIYDDVMRESRENRDSHIRFAGKKFIEEQIESYLEKYGYGK